MYPAFGLVPLFVSLTVPAYQPVIMGGQLATLPPVPALTDTLAEADLLTFQDDGSRMTLPVTIGPAGPYPFIVDTGAERTVISHELAATLRLARGGPVRVTAMGGTAATETVVIPLMNVGSINGSRIEAPAFFARNMGAPGMVGIDALQDRALAIDFDRNVMTVSRAVKVKHTETIAPGEIVVHAKSLFGQLVVTDAYFEQTRIRVILDTGSAVSMGNSALLRRVRMRIKPTQPIELTGVTGDKLTADYTQIDSVKVGGVIFNNLPVAFSEAAPFRHFGLTNKPALMLGMDALRMFRHVRIDFANREIRLAMPRDFANQR